MTYVGKARFGQILYGSKGDTLVAVDAPARPVESTADFPNPVAGVITLPSGTAWQVVGTVDITPNRVALEPGAVLLGTVPGQSSLLTSVAQPLVSDDGVDGSRIISEISLRNTTGPVLQFGNMPTGTLLVQNVSMDSSGSAGTVTDVGQVIFDGLSLVSLSNGLTLSGTINFVSIDEMYVRSPGSGFVGITVSGAANSIQAMLVEGMVAEVPTGVTALSVTPGVVVRGLLTSCIFRNTGGTVLTGITPGSAGWWISTNQGLRDSTALADSRFSSTTAVVVPAPVANQWVALTPVTFALGSAERFTLAGDVLTYTGDDPTNLNLTAFVSAEHAGGGGSVLMGVTVQVAGAPAVGSTTASIYEAVSEVQAASASQVTTTLSLVDVQPGAQFRILARNRTNTNSLEVFASALTVSVG